jgi:hypothetical protein
MTNMSNTNMSLADFERLLEVYGAARTRWPAEARAAAAGLVARDRTAQQLLAEAEALDRVLGRAPQPSLVREAALAERIVASAQRSPRIVRISRDDAPPAPASYKGTVVHLPPMGATRRRWRIRPQIGGTASLLAASLAMGIFLGLSSVPQSVVPALEEMAGLSTNIAANQAQLDPLDEELL